MNDLALDSAFDLEFKGGDLLITQSTHQHQQCLLFAEKGSFKQFPTLGVGIMSFLKDDDTGELLREIRLQFSKDGMKVNQLGFDGGKLKIEAPYGN